MRKRTWSIGVLLLLVVFLLTGCGRDTPEMEFASADEAKEALNTASTIEIYTDLYSKRRETKILADGKAAGYVKWNTVYIDDQEWFSVEYTSDVKGEKSSTGYGYYDAEGTAWDMHRNGIWIWRMAAGSHFWFFWIQMARCWTISAAKEHGNCMTETATGLEPEGSAEMA